MYMLQNIKKNRQYQQVHPHLLIIYKAQKAYRE